MSGTIPPILDSLATFRLIHQPLQALVYSVYMLVSPALGGRPCLLKNPAVFDFSQGWLMVTYDPIPKPHPGLQLLFRHSGDWLILWLVLLARCIPEGLRDEHTRRYVHVALVWLVYNLIFYNVGEETSAGPPLSWRRCRCRLGARRLCRFAVVVCRSPLLQLVTLHEVKSLLVTITH